MKKIFLLLFSSFLVFGSLQAQDLIVTTNGDSINCKITKIERDYVHFVFNNNEEVQKTLLPKDQIETSQKEYFLESELPADFIHKDIFPRFRAEIDGGWQYRTAKLADGMDAGWREHYKKMKSGFHYDIRASYFFVETQGVELMFSRQLFESSGDGYFMNPDGSPNEFGELKDKMAFNYVGANYLFRLFDSKRKNCWLFSAGFGYMSYCNRLLFNTVEDTKITAATFGSNFTIGYDIYLSGNFDLGFKLSLMSGTFRNYKLTQNGITTEETMPEKTAEGLGTIKVSVGLRFNK